MIGNYIKYAVISICFLFAACTEVDICDSSVQHPHVAEIDLTWNGADEDSVVVLAYRVVNTWRCGYILDPATKEGHYLYNSLKIEEKDNLNDNIQGGDSNESTDGNQTENENGTVDNDTENSGSTTDEETAVDSTPVDDYSMLPFVTKCGELFFTAFTYNTANEYLTCGKYDVGKKNGAENATVRYKKSYSKNEEPLAQGWQELNPGYKYVRNIPDEAEVYYSTIMKDIEEGFVNKVEITPKGVLQPIKFNINIEPQGVVIDKVIAEISGVSSSFNLFRETADSKNTYKMLFELDADYTCKVNVLGLVRSNSFTSLKGNGILQVAIHANGKVYNAQMNIFNAINAYGKIIAGGKENVELNIDAPLVVTANGLKTEVKDSYADKWVIK